MGASLIGGDASGPTTAPRRYLAPGREHRPDQLAWVGRPLRSALWLLGGLAALMTLYVIALVADAHPDLGPAMAIFSFTGLANVAVGLIAWARRPNNHTGLLLCLAGFAILVAAAGNTDVFLLQGIGAAVAEAPIGALLHLLLAFPSGRVRQPGVRWLVAGGYGVTIGLQLVRVLTLDSTDPTVPWPHPAVAHAASTAKSAIGALILVTASVVLYRRVVADRRTRQGSWALQLVYGYGIAMLWFLPLSANVITPLLGWSPVTRFVAQMTTFLAMPFVFAAGILRGRFARTGQIDELAVWIGADPGGRLPLRDALAAALGDPTVDLLPAGPAASWAQALGPAAAANLVTNTNTGPTTDTGTLEPGRGLVPVPGAGGPVAVISYDATLIADPALVEAAGRVVALALEREQLTAELLRSNERIRASRARLVEVADDERRRIAADLHDGLQARLVLSALKAGTLAAGGATPPGPGPAADSPDARTAAGAIRDELNGAIADLRRLVQGLLPAVLLERGLFAAAEDLLDRLPMKVELHTEGGHVEPPLPPAVASTGYFILSEAVTNALKHGAPGRVTVDLRREPARLQLTVSDDGSGGDIVPGHGLRAMLDRVDALDGTLSIDSAPGRGTTIRVELPCGS